MAIDSSLLLLHLEVLLSSVVFICPQRLIRIVSGNTDVLAPVRIPDGRVRKYDPAWRPTAVASFLVAAQVRVMV